MHLVSELNILKKEKALQTFELAFLSQVKMIFFCYHYFAKNTN